MNDDYPPAVDLAAAAFGGKNVLVTGGAGFMGSDVVRAAIAGGARRVGVLDALTYAGDIARLDGVADDPRFLFVEGDIRDEQAVAGAFDRVEPDVVLHYAAETHVTRSEVNEHLFFDTNVEGTRRVCEAAAVGRVRRFVHVSTDEVYGPVLDGAWKEDDKLPGEGRATSPYARSKALADDVATVHASEIPVAVLRFGNVFGAFQDPEKAIARWITHGLMGLSLPVWGDGRHVRQWTSVEDHTVAVATVVAQGVTGAFNVAGDADDITNVEVAGRIAASLGLDPSIVRLTGYDRPGHDARYSIDTTKIRSTGWGPHPFEPSLARTVAWYAEHGDWWKAHVDEAEALYQAIGETAP